MRTLLLRTTVIVALLSSHIQAQDDATLDALIFTDAPVDELTTWDQDYELKLSLGYCDNILLTPTVERDSFYHAAEINAFFSRIPTPGQADIYWYLLAENVDFLDVSRINDENLAVIQTRLSKELNDALRLGAYGQYVYSDRVFSDVEPLDPNPVIGKTTMHQFGVRPFLNYEPAERTELRLETPVKRRSFDGAVTDDYLEFQATASLIRRLQTYDKIRGEFILVRRIYDDLRARDRSGSEIPDADLIWDGWTAVGSWRRHWGREGAFWSEVKLAYGERTDNEFGYDDLYDFGGTFSIGYDQEPWELQINIDVLRKRYDQQTDDDDDAGASSRRWTGDLDMDASIERSLTDHMNLFVRCSYEERRSNWETDTFESTTIMIGLECRI